MNTHHPPGAPLVDSFGRTHSSLRLSVTDRCNIRCVYCMPAEVQFLPRKEILTFEEFVRFVRVAAGLGVDRLRLTGGEPLVRNDLAELVRQLKQIHGIQEVTLTTNGLLLARHAAALKAAGLARINVSLDSVREAAFERLTRREGLAEVLSGIAEAKRVGLAPIRLNAIAMRGVTEEEVIPLGRFAREQGLELRFIEFMPLDADQRWSAEQVLTGDEIRGILESEFGPLLPRVRPDPSQPATDFEFAQGGARIGFINPVSQPFCGDCNRLRMTAEGQVCNCLFGAQEWDARTLIRRGASDAELAALIRSCVAAKKPGHGIDDPGFLRPDRAMYQIGG